MKELLIVVLLALPTILVGHQEAEAATIAYVVNADTVYANLTYDRQWIDFLEDRMGKTVNVITDDSAALITTPSAYGGYFLSATITGANLSNLDTTSRGVVICDQLMYDDFRVGTGQTGVTALSYQSNFNRVDSAHAITKHMFDRIYFDFNATTYHYAYTGLPDSAHVLFTPSVREWDGIEGTPDTSFCYALESGVPLTSGTAQGRRVVALSFYGMLTARTDVGWCHPYELMGNICGWAWGDEQNAYNANYNCYSNDNQTTPGPEVQQAWGEYGSLNGTGREVYNGARSGEDFFKGIMFLNFRWWDYKTMPGFEPDSLIWQYRIAYHGFGTDNPPHVYDTVAIVTVNSTTSMTIDTTTRNLSTVSTYDWFFQGSQSYGIVIRSGVGADTTQVGDTCRISYPSSGQTSAAVTYIVSASSVNPSGIWNGTAGGQMRLLVADPYGGFDYWLKVHRIIPQTIWNAPRASLTEGGNPEGSATRTWANRNFIKSGNADSVRWSVGNLAAGVDYEAAAVCSVRINKTTFAPDGSTTIRLNIPGAEFNDPLFNGFVVISTDQAGGIDSTEIEIIGSKVNTVRGSFVQKFEMYLSDASPQTLGVEDTTYTISGVYGMFANGFNYNVVVNTGDGVIGIDSVIDNKSWLFLGNASGSTPLSVLHVIDTTGFGIGADTATVLIYASGADNTPLTYYVIFSQTAPPVETPTATVEKRTGLRLQ